MEGLAGTTPCMDWQATYLEVAWKSFKSHVEFVFSGPLKGKSEEEKCSYFMIWTGEKGRNMFQTWNHDVIEKKLLDSYYTKFEAYVKPRSNEIYNRYKFQTKCQEEGETFEQFATHLQIRIKDYKYPEQDKMVRDRIVIGIRNQMIREKLISWL